MRESEAMRTGYQLRNVLFFSSVFLRGFRRHHTEVNLNDRRYPSITLDSRTMITSDVSSDKGSLSKHNNSERPTPGPDEQLPSPKSDIENPNSGEIGDENLNPIESSPPKTEFMRKRSLQLSDLSPETFVPKVRRSQSDTQAPISSTTSTSYTPLKSVPEDGGILPHIKGEKDAIKRITPHTVNRGEGEGEGGGGRGIVVDRNCFPRLPPYPKTSLT
jgi:hypothetical protein